MKQKSIEEFKRFRDFIDELSMELGLTTEETIELYTAYNSMCIHQHLEQLVYKNEKVQT